MIIDTSQGDIEVVGDIKEFKTSIDPKNLEFITTLLSSNLYSDPEQSFIREIVSNAWDSHVEAGTTDVPVIVRFKNTYSEKSVTIRDYGVGLSPERFQEVYCNIGSSTKRESNDFIGGFGIGKYSSLACSNTVYITSYYEGKAYYYVMVKSGNSITTNLLDERPTDERNGVEVTIKNISDLTPFNKALQFIVFFPNVYIDGAESADRINSTKLKRFSNFAAASIPIEYKLLLGNVLYPCNKYHLSWDAQQFINKISSTGIVIKFDVGEINITPNRESIIYNSDTIKKIEDRISKAKKELDALVDAKLTKGYDNIDDYLDMVSKAVNYEPVSDTLTPSFGYTIEPASMSPTSITYKGVDLRDDVRGLRNIFGATLPNFKGVVWDDKIYNKKLPWQVSDNNHIKSKKILILNKGARMLPSVKLYLKDHYDEYGVMTDLSLQEFRDYLENELGSLLLPKADNYDLITEGVYNSLMERADSLDLETDKSFLDFKDELSASRISGIVKEKEAILYVWNDKGWKDKKNFKRFSHAVDYIRGLKKGVILTNMDSDESLFSSLANLKNYAYIKARKDIVSDLKSLNLNCMVDINWLVSKDPMLSVVATIIKHFPGGIPGSDLHAISSNLPEDIVSEFYRLRKVDGTYRENYIYRSMVDRIKPPIDQYTEYLCIRLKNYLTKHKEASELVTSSGCTDSTITTAVVIRTKAYRVSNAAYNRVKNNRLIKVLCRK